MMRGRAIIVFGLPGSGKRTQVANLCVAVEERGQTCQVIEVGRCLRAITATQHSSFVAESLAEVMSEGRLVPEIFPLYVLAKEVIETPLADVVIMDGFGRRLPELKMVLRLFGMVKYQIDAVLLDISTDEARKRLFDRGREDDVPEAITQRICAYQGSTKVSLRYLRRNTEQVSFYKIDGVGTVDEVHQRLIDCLIKNKTPY